MVARERAAVKGVIADIGSGLRKGLYNYLPKCYYEARQGWVRLMPSLMTYYRALPDAVRYNPQWWLDAEDADKELTTMDQTETRPTDQITGRVAVLAGQMQKRGWSMMRLADELGVALNTAKALLIGDPVSAGTIAATLRVLEPLGFDDLFVWTSTRESKGMND